MANTSFARGGNNTASVEEIWGEKTYRQAEKDSFFNDGRFVGTDANSLIQVNMDLTKNKGDLINTPLRARLIDDGKVDDAAIEGSEVALTFHNCQTTIRKRKQAVRLDGEMTEQRTKIKLRGEAKDALAMWHADSRDEDIVLGLSGLANAVATVAASVPTSARRFIGGQKTDSSGLVSVATDALLDDTAGIHLFGTAVLTHLKRLALTDGGASYGKIRPIIIKGKKYYVYFASPLQVKALKTEDRWINAQKDANIRGEENPIFSGACGMWDGIIIHEYDRIQTRTGAGGATAPEVFEVADPLASGISASRGLFCGAQAGILAYGRKIGWKEKVFEYDSQFGVEVSSVYGFNKAKFNSQDFAVIACDTRVDLDP